MRVCVCVGFLMCVFVCVCMCGVCNVCVCVCVCVCVWVRVWVGGWVRGWVVCCLLNALTIRSFIKVSPEFYYHCNNLHNVH